MGVSLNFDARGVDPTSPFDPIPAGEYRMHVTDSEMKPTRAGTGRYLQLELTVLDGEYKGRKVWERLNLDNPNKTAVEIAQKTLSAICHASGVLTLTNSTQLHHKPMLVKVTVKQDEGQDPQNEIKKYKPDPMAAASAPAATAPTPVAAAAAPPWAAKKAS